MTNSVLRNIIGSAALLALVACSAISRRSEQQKAQEPPTPLDMPKEPLASPNPGEAPHPSDTADSAVAAAPAPDAPATPETSHTPPTPADNGPTVTLIKKDGTPVENKPIEAAKNSLEWSYDVENGPTRWADLKPEYATCRDGKEQSPIDLKWHKPLKKNPLTIRYKNSKAHIVNNGHTIELDFDPGSSVLWNGDTYDLIDAHFHTVSEHTISGRQFPIEMHLVHKNSAGKLLVTAVLFKSGKDNPTIAKVWTALPTPPATEGGTAPVVDLKKLVPTTHTHYEYQGSLTVPPCTEGVQWIVFNNALQMSDEQVKTFQQFYPENARPVQPINGRRVVNY